MDVVKLCDDTTLLRLCACVCVCVCVCVHMCTCACVYQMRPIKERVVKRSAYETITKYLVKECSWAPYKYAKERVSLVPRLSPIRRGRAW